MNYIREIRQFLFDSALADLSIVRWTLLEEQMNGAHATEYIDALLAHRNANQLYESASKNYKTFLKSGTNDWEEEERLYELVRKYRGESERTNQVIQDMLLESDEYKTMEPEEVPGYV